MPSAGYPQLAYDLNAFVVNKIPERWEMTKRVLESLRTEDPSREIVLATEPFFVGAIPMLYGAPLPKGFSSRPKVVNISPLPYCGESIDLPIAIGTGLLPDSTESGRRRNEVIRELLLTGPFADTVAMFGQIIKDTGGCARGAWSLTTRTCNRAQCLQALCTQTHCPQISITLAGGMMSQKVARGSCSWHRARWP
jgi:hypothetical protein